MKISESEKKNRPIKIQDFDSEYLKGTEENFMKPNQRIALHVERSARCLDIIVKCITNNYLFKSDKIF